MIGFNLGFQLGAMYGFAIGASIEHRQRKVEKKRVLHAQDILILDYIKSKSIVYMDDLIGYLGFDDDIGARRSIGHSMAQLGWERRRAGDQRWYYTRGPKAVAYVEPSR